MSSNAENFNSWIRGRFVDLNSELEEIYFAQADRAAVELAGAAQKKALVEEGLVHVEALRRQAEMLDAHRL